jgi:hypothetical protein
MRIIIMEEVNEEETKMTFFAAPIRKGHTVVFVGVGFEDRHMDPDRIYVDFVSYYRATKFPRGGARSRLQKAFKEKAKHFVKSIPKHERTLLERASLKLGYTTSIKLFSQAVLFIRLNDMADAIRSCYPMSSDSMILTHEEITDMEKVVIPAFEAMGPAIDSASAELVPSSKKTSSCSKDSNTHFYVNATFSTNIPNGYRVDGLPPLLALQFSLYKVPIEPQTKTSTYYVDRWKAYNNTEECDGWTHRDLISTLYRSGHALPLAKWRNMFHNTKLKKRKKTEDNVAHILAIRSDDLKRSGLCVGIEEAMENVAYRILNSRSVNAINYLFPTMVKDDVVYLKTYFSDKKDLLPERIRGFLPKSTFRVNMEHFDTERRPSEEEAMEMLKHVAYIEHLHRLDQTDQRAVSMAMFTQVMKARQRRKIRDALKRRKGAAILVSEEEVEESEDDPPVDRIRVYGSAYAEISEGDRIYMQEGIKAIKPYQRCNRKIPPFAVRCNPTYYLDPYVAVDALPKYLSREEDGEYVVELPKETYRLIPIWLFPLVMDACRGDLLIDMVADEFTIVSRIHVSIQEAIDEKLDELGKVHVSRRPTNPLSVSPMESVAAQEVIVKGCQTLLRHAMHLYETFHKRQFDDLWRTCMTLNRRVGLNEERNQALYEMIGDMKKTMGIHDEEEWERHSLSRENSLSSLGME